MASKWHFMRLIIIKMKINIILGLTILLKTTLAIDKNTPNSNLISDNLDTIITVVFLTISTAFLLHQRRNNYQYIRVLRGMVGHWLYRFSSQRAQRKLRQKIDAEQPPALKNAPFKSQTNNLQNFSESLGQQEQLFPKQQEILAESPHANFKEVFTVKQSKSKHKVNKKSKSKLKSRLVGKASDGEEEEQEGSSFVRDELVQETQFSLDIGGKEEDA